MELSLHIQTILMRLQRLELELRGGYPKKLYVCPSTPVLTSPHRQNFHWLFSYPQQRYSPNSTFSIRPFAICSPVCNFHTRSELSWAQVTILYLSVVCMTPKTEPICSWNLLRDFIGFVSFVKTAGSKDVFIREDFGRLTQNRVSSSSANSSFAKKRGYNQVLETCFRSSIRKVAPGVGVLRWELSVPLQSLM